jgi:hypothetical protein
MFTACVCIGDCLISVPEKILIMRTILLHCIQLSSDIVKLKEVFLPHTILSGFWDITQNFLNMVCTRFRKMVWGRKTSFNFTISDDSCIQCNSIVRMIRIFSGTDMIKKMTICLIEVPNCPGKRVDNGFF